MGGGGGISWGTISLCASDFLITNVKSLKRKERTIWDGGYYGDYFSYYMYILIVWDNFQNLNSWLFLFYSIEAPHTLATKFYHTCTLNWCIQIDCTMLTPHMASRGGSNQSLSKADTKYGILGTKFPYIMSNILFDIHVPYKIECLFPSWIWLLTPIM